MQSRKSLIVYFKSPKVLKKLKSLGNLTYYHKKRKYAVLYVNGDKIDTIMNDIKRLHHVKYVELSRLDDSPLAPEELDESGKTKTTNENKEECSENNGQVSSEKT
jgi:uncharacterized protein YlbG (UPF0298 family)